MRIKSISFINESEDHTYKVVVECNCSNIFIHDLKDTSEVIKCPECKRLGYVDTLRFGKNKFKNVVT